MRVAIYARFSSELQERRSITDQVALAREYATREGWTIVEAYADEAISGASIHNRAGLLDMMVAAAGRKFDIVLTESVDRLSRDQEDMAGLHKRLSYFGIQIVTLADGKITKLHVGIKGLLGSLWLDELAAKTRRGQRGRVAAGKIPGGRCYGYDVTGLGDRSINAAEAEIVRRIYREYLSGRSPLSIAAELNREGVPGPRGGQWNSSALNGSVKRANGLLTNTLYAGVLTYNRQRFVKDPSTGKRQARTNPRNEWIAAELPHLRIVDQELWDGVQTKRRDANHGPQAHHHRRPKHLLSGLVRCGGCGGAMIVHNRATLRCSTRQNRGTCDARRAIKLREIENRVVDALDRYLLDPDIVASAIEAYREERARRNAIRARWRRDSERDLAIVDRKIASVVGAIEDGGGRALIERLKALELERGEVVARLPEPDGAGDVVELHPQAAGRYKAAVAGIREALQAGEAATREAIGRARELISAIIVRQTPAGQPLDIEVTGQLAALMSYPAKAGMGTVVAGAGFEPTTFRL